MAQTKAVTTAVKNIGEMIEVINHGAGRKNLKPKEAQRYENMKGTRNLRFWYSWSEGTTRSGDWMQAMVGRYDFGVQDIPYYDCEEMF